MKKAMNISQNNLTDIPEQQRTIRDKCMHPNGTFIPFPTKAIEQSLPVLFEKQVRTYPNQLAIKTRYHTLTYTELNWAANRLAHAIVEQRGSKEENISLLLDHGALLIIAILGVLKAGKVYVPLDPSYPHKRLTYMLEDSQAELLLTTQTNRPLAEVLTQKVPIIDIDEPDSTFPVDNLDLPRSPESLAFILYTSGSTGKPKGFSQTHCNVILDTRNYTNTGHFCADDRFLLVSSVSFADSVRTIYSALLNGAALYPFDIRTEGLASMANWLIQNEITIYRSVPTVFRHFMSVLNGEEKFTKVRLIYLSGEPVYKKDVELYRAHFSVGCIFVNRLGTGEGLTFRMYFIDMQTSIKQVHVPVGYAVPDKEVVFIGDVREEKDGSHTGEIAVKSEYLSPGYWKRPDLTKTTFLPDPEGGSSRIYRTGDLGRMLPDGCLVHLGRKDFQVKIRGYRIEIAEIEMALLDHIAIKETIVRPWEGETGDQCLVAYLVPAKQKLPTISEIRRFLAEVLPNYMIPSFFVMLDALPLLPNGKLNRRALPPPDRLRPELKNPHVDPRTPVEERLSEIWAEVLNLDQVGINDKFFDLGGHSLLATQVISRVINTFRVNVSIRSLFQASTVADMALVIVQEIAEKAENKDVDRMLAELENLSDGEAHRNLADESVNGDIKMSDISQRIASLSPEKRAFLELRLKKQTMDTGDIHAIPKRAKQSQIPLSFAQQRLWFLEQFEPNSAIYNTTLALKLEGPLNTRALQQSLNGIISRHESLRTTFKVLDGQPIQKISAYLEIVIPTVDIQLLPPDQQEMEVQRLLNEEALRPFDLETGPLLRVTLFCLKSQKYVILFSMHHIITDGWSQGIFLREFSNLYTSYSLGKPVVLSELPIQYADFSEWQRGWLQGAVLEQQTSYWKEQLADPPVLNLLTDRARLPIPSHRGAKLPFSLNETVTKGIITLSRNERVTVFMTLLASFNVLLFRYLAQEDLLVGTPIANRTHKELEDLIGFFANTLVLRTDLSGNPSFKELLIRVRDVSLSAYSHQDLPFEKLIEELLVERDLSRNPLFQVMFVFQNTPTGKLELEDVSITHMDVGNDLAKFDLTLEFTQQDSVLKGCFEYNADLFDPETIQRMSEQYQTILAGIISDPDQPISKLPLMSKAEREQLLEGWNETNVNYPNDKCIHEIFEAQVEITPDAVAVVIDCQRLSYRELNERANQLARFLINEGTGPADLVGLYLERSIEMVVGIIATLKAGCAYVPLDPSYPIERLNFMIRDTQVSVILSQERLQDLAFNHKARVISFDSGWMSISTESSGNLKSRALSESPAYVMYTSGSTGVPKGVVVPHCGVVRLVCGQDYISFDTKQRFLLLAPISFDASTLELWGPLLHGASVVIYPGTQSFSVAQLDKLIQQHSITTLWLTSSLFNMIVDQAPEILEPLSELLTGGEALSVAHVRKAQQKLPHVRLINGYGPTESTTFACCYPIPDKLNANAVTVPIGKPIANTRIYILDKFLHPVPVGVAGELYIGGDGLAIGYLNRPEATASRFILDPYSPIPGNRMYRTGDQARYLANGNIEFIGRLDHQIKVRGFRIELGEIETTLSAYPKVRSCVVVAHDDHAGSKQLVAYFVPVPNNPPSNSELHSFLLSKLPNYMVPTFFSMLETLPLTPNGKINRNALPRPDETSLVRESFVAPRTEIEKSLSVIWGKILNVQQISIHDDFFKLGGHSLLATQVISRVINTFRVNVSIRSLFQASTVADMALVIVQEIAEKAENKDVDRMLAELENLT